MPFHSFVIVPQELVLLFQPGVLFFQNAVFLLQGTDFLPQDRIFLPEAVHFRSKGSDLTAAALLVSFHCIQFIHDFHQLIINAFFVIPAHECSPFSKASVSIILPDNLEKSECREKGGSAF